MMCVTGRETYVAAISLTPVEFTGKTLIDPKLAAFLEEDSKYRVKLVIEETVKKTFSHFFI
jgi:hypothetical protein